jgi:hypothetical protein
MDPRVSDVSLKLRIIHTARGRILFSGAFSVHDRLLRHFVVGKSIRHFMSSSSGLHSVLYWVSAGAAPSSVTVFLSPDRNGYLDLPSRL